MIYHGTNMFIKGGKRLKEGANITNALNGMETRQLALDLRRFGITLSHESESLQNIRKSSKR